MNNGNVLGLFREPEREESLRAVSLALLRIRANGMTCEALGKVLGCSKDTIENASNEKSMLGFDCIARMLFHFREESSPIEALWLCRAPAQLTTAERLERIKHDADAIAKEIGQ